MYKNYSTTAKTARDFKLQDVYLNHCRREKISVEIHTLDSSIQEGIIVGFDNHAIIMENNSRQNMVYKNAVVSVNPQTEVNHIFNENYRDIVPGEMIASKVSDRYSKYTADFS